MASIDLQTFFRQALGFSDDRASRLAHAYSRGCILLGLAAGVGLASAVSKDLMKPMQSAPSKSMALRTILAGLGVGSVAGATACVVVKLKIQEFLDQQFDTAQAIGNCKGDVAARLREEANKLLALSDKIDQYYEEEDERFPYRA